MAKQKAKMLIVEDEPATRSLLSQIFERLGHSVSAAEDGFSALEQIRKETPDILLSDLNMPGMSGFELLSVVRRKTPGIYVIASSGAFAAGDGVPNGIAADAFHEKASGLNQLFELVNAAPGHEELLRDASDESIPIWISPIVRNVTLGAEVLITCPECLRAFSLSVGEADFVIHQTRCIYCNTAIHYATVQPMNSMLPHCYHSQLADAIPVLDRMDPMI